MELYGSETWIVWTFMAVRPGQWVHEGGEDWTPSNTVLQENVKDKMDR